MALCLGFHAGSIDMAASPFPFQVGALKAAAACTSTIAA